MSGHYSSYSISGAYNTVGYLDLDLIVCCRVEERDPSRGMTQEVVTQYYRPPEILLGQYEYSTPRTTDHQRSY